MKNYKITISRVNQGWIAEVGCQVIVFTDKDKLVEAFCDYMKDSSFARAKWIDTDLESIPEQPTSAENAPMTSTSRY
jgi:hypothetical protein